MKKYGLLVFLLLSVSLSYFLYKPLPPTVADLWNVRVYIFIIDSIMDISVFGERLGFGPWMNFARFLQDSLTSYFVVKPLPKGMKVTDSVFDGVPVRLYLPRVTENEVTGAVIYYHGGGWVWGSIQTYEPLTMALAIKTGMPVLSINYRRAPEVTFPIPLDDCWAATIYFLNHAKIYNVDPKRVVIMGDSAGGNLAAAMALRFVLRKEAFVPVAQVLIYPVLQAIDLNLPAYIDNDGLIFLSRERIALHVLLYLGLELDLMNQLIASNHTTATTKAKYAHIFDVNLLPEKYRTNKYRKSYNEGSPEVVEKMQKKVTDPFFSPLLAPEELLQGSPKAYILTAELDVLRDDGIFYANRLSKAGVPVEMVDYSGAYHPFIMQFEAPLKTQLATQALDAIVTYVKQMTDAK